MDTATYTPAMLLAILPEISLVVLGAVLLVLDLIWGDRRCGRLGWFTAGGMVVIMALSLAFARPTAEARLIFGGMLRLDMAGFVFRMLFLSGAALTALFSLQDEDLCVKGEFFVLLTVSTLGLSLMASAADLIMLYLAMETASLPLYAMAGFRLNNPRSAEAGIKYLLFGAMSSALMLYGFSLIYGLGGTTNLYGLGAPLSAGDLPFLSLAIAALLALAGFAFKISAVPFHFWAPDVYHGAPTQVAGFLSTASKAAGFVVLLRALAVLFPMISDFWQVVVIVLAIASMTLGNLLALTQKSLKRLLAYSSIAQAGYILVGVAANNEIGAAGAIYYLISYLVTNLLAFGLVMVVERTAGTDDLTVFAGLGRRSRPLGLLLLAAMLSLGGIPPFAGFFGKLWVFGGAVQAHLWWLALIGLLNSVIGLYYYLRVLKIAYLDPASGEFSVSVIRGWALALGLCALGVVVLGVIYAPVYDWAVQAAQTLLSY
ncbi:MAG TPA: NADH-quinone oxidoreductase subunit N [Anaerolineaceae bacterium]|nr:NADH-quinone oxidoreductase subunit N [Anaerolineaceae bacterium]